MVEGLALPYEFCDQPRAKATKTMVAGWRKHLDWPPEGVPREAPSFRRHTQQKMAVNRRATDIFMNDALHGTDGLRAEQVRKLVEDIRKAFHDHRHDVAFAKEPGNFVVRTLYVEAELTRSSSKA
jgi:hypothetical protein